MRVATIRRLAVASLAVAAAGALAACGGSKPAPFTSLPVASPSAQPTAQPAAPPPAPPPITCFEGGHPPPCARPAHALVTGLVYVDPVRVELFPLAVTIDAEPLYSGGASTAAAPAVPELTWELAGQGGAPLAAGVLDPQWTEPGLGLDEVGGYFDIVLPDVAGAAALRIRADGEVVAERAAGASAPTITGVTVIQDGRDATVTWEAADPDGDALTYRVIVREPGQPLQFAARRLESPEMVLTEWIDEGDAGVEVQVIATDGLNAAWARSAPFGATDDPPVLWFESGDEVMDVRDYAAIDVRVYGYDPEDGQDIIDTLTWTSSIDGELFSGTEFSYFEGGFYQGGEEIKAPALSSGEHLIAATLTDSAGQSTSLHFVLVVP